MRGTLCVVSDVALRLARRGRLGRAARLAMVVIALGCAASSAFAQVTPVIPDIGFDGPAVITAFGTSIGEIVTAVILLGLAVLTAWKGYRMIRRAC